MNANTIHLNVFPSYQEVTQFLDDILPRLIACGLNINPRQDNPRLVETADGYADVSRLEVYDREDKVFTLIDQVFTYVNMTDLAGVLEQKQVELQLNALLPRLATVGWTFKVDFAPTYANLDQLRKDLIRTEATRWVQQCWLELEAAGCEITLGTDVIIMRWKDNQKICGYTLEEVKTLTNEVLNQIDADVID